jgi:hypothetical protein
MAANENVKHETASEKAQAPAPLDMQTQMMLYSADPVALLGPLSQFGIKITLDSFAQMQLKSAIISAITALPAEQQNKAKQAVMFASFTNGGAGGFNPMAMMGGFGGGAGGFNPMAMMGGMFGAPTGDAKDGATNPMEQYFKMQMQQQMIQQMFGGGSKDGAAAKNPMEQYMQMQMMQSMFGGGAGGFNPMAMMGGMFGGAPAGNNGGRSSAY